MNLLNKDNYFENNVIISNGSTEKIFEDDKDIPFQYNIDNSDDNGLNTVIIKKPAPKKNYKRRNHHCPYCDISVQNFARHLERQHYEELEVARFLALKKRDPVRKKIIDKIRKEGDFTSGKYVPVQGSTSEEKPELTSNLLPCIHCKGQSKILYFLLLAYTSKDDMSIILYLSHVFI